MTSLASDIRPTRRPAEALFILTVFASAALVFLVEPMVAKLVLPMLGGSSSVWNTSLAFFQGALLLGYAYAHVLQRFGSLRVQAAIHCAALMLAALVLPLHINQLFGPPSSDHPALWLLGVLTVSIGAPFAVLSASAPLVQAWHARTAAAGEGAEPYALYAASNLGSLLALLFYPLVIEPTLTVRVQTLGWTAIYIGFVVLMAGLALKVARVAPAPTHDASSSGAAAPVGWTDRLIWIALAAIPSSLMLGVTTYITTDIASAPFLWVVPLALYLTTFIIAFQTRPAMSPQLTLVLQGAALAACVAILPYRMTFFPIQLGIHLGAFFLTALMCHQALVARRPAPARLTEFYLWMSFGGVVGGAFNAFAAPVLFNNVWEYPLVLVMAALARPWGDMRIVGMRSGVLLGLGVVAALATPVIHTFIAPHVFARPVVGQLTQIDLLELAVKLTLAVATVCAFLLRDRAVLYCAVIAVISISASQAADRVDTTQTWRSFFGVLRQSQTFVPSLGQVKMLAHGTTLHGAQAIDPKWACRPLVYYAPSTPIGQVFRKVEAEKPAIRIGAVGLGTGSVSAYVRATDRLTFFEIDPLVIRVSSDPAHFSYTTRCAKGPIDYVLGDARLTVAKQPLETFDILLIDAFSSDAVPAHLLTVEAVKGYLTHLKPDGVLILHLSNRNLDLKGPAQAVARAAGGVSLIQDYRPAASERADWASAEDALIIGRSSAGLARFAADAQWKPTGTTVRPWTDDYTNLFGALWRRTAERMKLGALTG